KKMPPMDATNIIAFGIFFLGRTVSSDKVVMASNPIKARASSAAAPNNPENSLVAGVKSATLIKLSSPLTIDRYVKKIKINHTNICNTTNNRLIEDAILTPNIFKMVMIAIKPTIQAQLGTLGNPADRYILANKALIIGKAI